MANTLNYIRVVYKGHTISLVQHTYSNTSGTGASLTQEVLDLGLRGNDYSGDPVKYGDNLNSLIAALKEVRDSIDNADTHE
jgi:hypothetical protein